ncbi:MAG: response regulator [Methanobacteriota archaeon]
MTKGSRILVVEDEMVISLEISATLRRLGYEVIGQAITGLDAIHLADEADPDLILMDIRLKGDMDGIEAASRIRENNDRPVIFLTAHSDDVTLERAIAVSPSGYLIKPFKDRELYSSIELALHKHCIRERLRPERIGCTDASPDILEIPGVGVALTSTRGSVIRVNSVLCQLFGAGSADICGTRIAGWITGTDSSPGDSKISGTIIPPGIINLLKHNGEVQLIRIETGFIVGEDGLLQGYLLAFHPIQ